MKIKIFLIILLFSFVFPLTLDSMEEPKLPEKYKKWMEKDVVYIMTPKEKEVFSQLETNRERDLFVEEFWRQRDPTPGTANNEFKEEHYRRIKYANKHFGKHTPLEGWRTDMGRIYIILGPPGNRQRYDTIDIYPIEIWYYHGNPKYGQAPIFRLLFFKRRGMGEFELYSPMADGPKSLVHFIMRREELVKLATSPEEEPTEPRERSVQFDSNIEPLDKIGYRILKDNVSPELAEASFSNFPGRDGPENRLPSSILIHELDIYPHKKVKDDYAYEFLEHKAVVEVSYSVYHMWNQSKVNIIQDPSDFFFVNYVIVPETLSFDLYKDKYFTNLKASMRVTDFEGKTVFQWERNIPIELKEKELKIIGKRPFHLYDSFPLISGNYIFNLLLENTVSKEFTSFERRISVPDAKNLQMSSLILARKVNKDSPYSPTIRSFQVGNLQIYPTLRNIFLKEDTLHLFFQIYGLGPEFGEEGVLEFTFYRGDEKFLTKQKKLSEYENRRDFLEEFSLERFLSGSYAVKVALLDREGKEALFEKEEFSVSTKPLPGSWIVAQTNPPSDDPFYSYILGNQFLNKGDIRRAHNELAKAYEGKPGSRNYALSYARVLLILKEFQRVKEILTPFVVAERENFEICYFLGKASQHLGELEGAISYYQSSLSHKGNVIDVLNAIGECYFRLGDNEEALMAWQRSLEINPNQEKIKKAIEDIKRKR